MRRSRIFGSAKRPPPRGRLSCSTSTTSSVSTTVTATSPATFALKRVAAAVASELRSTDDLAVRYGGEEFLVLMPDTELSAAVRIAERIRRQIEELAIPHEGVGQLGIVTVSLGVIAGPTATHHFVDLIAGADAALYAAKRGGRNQVWPPFVSRHNPVALLRKKSA